MLIRYADPTRCPSCAYALPPHPRTCPQCRVPLSGSTVEDLFATLQRADVLVGRLRATAAPAPAPTQAPSPAVVQAPAGTPYPAQPYPTPTQPAPTQPVRTGPTLGVVPKVLLGLGALFLLVGALTFLAMAWTMLGVGGRTVILIAITLGVAAGSWLLARKGLRIGAEAMSLVALGLFTLDLFGAQNAGWLGDLDAPATMMWFGGCIGAVSLAVTFASRLAGGEPLVAPQTVGVPALHVAGFGLTWQLDHPTVALAVCLAVWLVLSEVSRLTRLEVLAYLSGLSAAAWWCGLAGWATVRFLNEPSSTYADVLTSSAWVPLLLAVAALTVLPRCIGWARRLLPLTVGTGSLMLLLALLLPVYDEPVTPRTLVLTGLLVAASAAVLLVPARTWKVTPAIPAAWLWLVSLSGVLTAMGSGAVALSGAGEFLAAPVTATLQPVDPGPTHLLVLACGLGVAVLPLALQRAFLPQVPLATQAVVAACATAVLTLVQFPVPLALVVAVLLGCAAGGVVGLVRTGRTRGTLDWPLAVMTAVSLSAALVVALPSGALTTVALLACAAACAAGWVVAHRGHRADLASVAALALPVPLTLASWTGLHTADVDLWWATLVAAVVLAPVVLWRAEVPVEAGAGLVLGLSAVVSTSLHPEPLVWASLHLLVAACCFFATAALHAHRRGAAFVGSLMLVAALWCQLAHRDVTTVEAYSVPLAAALLVAGAVLMVRRPQLSSLVGLGGGLAVGLLPSLLVVLVTLEPVGLRDGLLLAASVALVVLGAARHLNAPLVMGAVTGTLLALNLAAPYGYVVPTFVWLAAAGIALTVCGITWEARLANVRATTAYLARLR
ncbi:MAG: SCO7613 C-terminal domain-containing membrane protein [Nocardioides sp.]|uniref:SCO7613 C-terminal domain-containing membrane protein n=1 Tax=Nocardioides sp. TaxID=35761 RepID=UPI003EFF36FF